MLNSLSNQNLDSWGQKCLARKKTRMANLLRIAEPDEALYREIMLALGYKNNKVQFLELSTITPYYEIRTLKDKDLSAVAQAGRIARALLYRAGLSENNKGLPDNFYPSLRMSKTAWNAKGIRPANYPERRIENISPFLAESCEAGGIADIFLTRISGNYTAQLDKNKAIKIARNIVSLNGIGRQRSLEILFNIILPFTLKILFCQAGSLTY